MKHQKIINKIVALITNDSSGHVEYGKNILLRNFITTLVSLVVVWMSTTHLET